MWIGRCGGGIWLRDCSRRQSAACEMTSLYISKARRLRIDMFDAVVDG